MPEVPRWLWGSHHSVAQPQSAATLAGLRRLLAATNGTPVGPSEERVRMPFLDQEGADLVVQGRSTI
ncbi:MAG: hypothetical protein JXQ88_15755 [Shimia sp.]